MDDETPPKRVTRSKATAKTTITKEPEVKIATAAAKARATRNITSTLSASSKRKMRTDDAIEETNNDEKPNEEPMDAPPARPKITRGRKKAVQVAKIEDQSEGLAEDEALEVVPEPAPARVTRKKALQAQPEANEPVEEEPVVTAPIPVVKKSTRGRPPKNVQPEPEVEEKAAEPVVPIKATRGRPKKAVYEAPPPAPEPPKITRGRPRKVQVAEEPPVEELAAEGGPELTKKTTRGHAATVVKAAAAPKKSVKFEQLQEQDKENIIPAIATRGKDVERPAGLKAKPVRRPVVSTRTTQTRARAAGTAEKQPLSPKKPTQVTTAKESVSEDELATMEKTPIKPLTKSPVRLPGSMLSPIKKLDFTTSLIVNRATTQDLGASLMASPARRPPPSPFKDSLKTSPKRLNFGNSMSPLKTSLQESRTMESLKKSLLQSPAKRPQSPLKVSLMGSPTRERHRLGATPKASTFNISRFGTTPRTLTKSVLRPGQPISNKPELEPSNTTPTKNVPLPSRMSSILPRNVDPALQEPVENCEGPKIVESSEDSTAQDDEPFIDLLINDPMLVDEPLQTNDQLIEEVQSTTPTNSPPRHSIGNFSRLVDENPFEDSDSEDELASNSPMYSSSPIKATSIPLNDVATPSTPSSRASAHRTPRTAGFHHSNIEDIHVAARSQSVKVTKEKVGFTPLAQQTWMLESATPKALFRTCLNEDAFKSPKVPGLSQETYAEMDAVIEPAPLKSSFFEDAISVCDEVAEVVSAIDEPKNEPNDGIDAVGFAPVTVDEEDLDLAAEADEMSLIAFQEQDVQESVNVLNQSPQGDVRALSEASQEYGDENFVPSEDSVVPIDPALLTLEAQTPGPSAPAMPAVVTPVRSFGEIQRVFHTVSKVPLKPAAEDSPLNINKRPASVFRMPAQRPAPPPPSYSGVNLPLVEQSPKPTPSRSSSWSTTATPVRTPRRDIGDQVLKGAVVFVDVHTTEGADASAVFVELLGQMGARCVKSWNWNPNASSSTEINDESEQSTSNNSGKIGITHVVFKDGGKRTLERVRESNGVVLCVGVGWVLDCERQQTWLSESPYTIDTTLVPRGGNRRRKSMEPRSIQNQNGMVSVLPNGSTPRSVSASHGVSPTKEFLNLPDTPGTAYKSNRRKSSLWARSPSSDGDAKNDSTGLMLSPVPATPAPETISAYAEHILDEESPDGAATPYFFKKEQLIQRTCPPKQSADSIDGQDMSGPVEGSNRGVLMQRLLLARRKSLQWAPKVGSPLAKPSFEA